MVASISAGRGDPGGASRVRWAARVQPGKIRRLYESDALGIYDEDLIDEVGIGLFARCESILRLTDAYIRGRIECPSCRNIVLIPVEGRHKKEVSLHCDRCGWETTWFAYKQTFQDKGLHAGNAQWIFREFVESYPRASAARQKMLLIDRLLHEFHRSALGDTGPAPRSVLEGTEAQILALLDSLAGYRPGEAANAWRERLAASRAASGARRREKANGRTGE